MTDLVAWTAAARRVLPAFGLSDAPLAPLGTGNNVVFRVETRGAPRALRLHRPGYRERHVTEAELRFQAAVGRATAVAVPEPVPSGRAGYTVAFETPNGATSHADLVTWCAGEVRRPNAGLTARDAARAGEALGALHAFAESAPPEAVWPVWDEDGLFTARSPYRPGPLEDVFTPEERAVFALVEARAREVLGALPRAKGTFGVIHADFILGNLLFTDEGVSVLDFDDSGLGFFLYDLCPLLGNLFEDGAYGAWKRAFLSGYALVRPVPDGADDEDVVRVLMAARHAAQCLWGAGLARGGSAFDARRHTAWRIGAMRRLLDRPGG